MNFEKCACTVCGKQLMDKDWPYLFRSFGRICTDCRNIAAALVSKHGKYREGRPNEWFHKSS